MAYLDACKLPEAMAYLIKADKMLCRVGSHDQDQARLFSQDASFIKKEVTRFESGVMSTMPCCWRPTSRQNDVVQMATLFVALQARNGKACRPRRCCKASAYGAFSM